MAKPKTEPELKTAEQLRAERDRLHAEVNGLLTRLFETTDAAEYTRLAGEIAVMPRKLYHLTLALEIAGLREQDQEVRRLEGQATEIAQRAAVASDAMSKITVALDREIKGEEVRLLENKSSQLRRQAQAMRQRIGDISGLDAEREETLPSAILNSGANQANSLRTRIAMSLESGRLNSVSMAIASNDD